jgi:hypothetical protein
LGNPTSYFERALGSPGFASVYVTDLAKPPSVSREGAPDIEHMHMQIRTAAAIVASAAVKKTEDGRFSMFEEP